VLRFSIRHARGLRRPRSELDGYPQEIIEKLEEEEEERVKAIRAPSAFAVITVDEREAYTTFEHEETSDPDWEESFDIKVRDLSTVVIRVFDRKCIDQGWPAFIGFTTFMPFNVLPPPRHDEVEDAEDPDADSGKVDKDDIPLVKEGVTISDMTISISLSTDTSIQPSLPSVPPVLSGPVETHVQRRVALVKWGNKKSGSKKETTTRVYEYE